MFKDYPIFGVGIDRFGEYYRQYAVQNQVVQGQITDNAHSIYMQLLATGGLTLFIPYMLLVLFVTYLGIKSMIKFKGEDKFKVSALLGIWLGTIALNVVTVDNLGVGVWLWITGGVLTAVAVNGQRSESAELDQKNKANRSKSSVLKNSETLFPVTYVVSFVLTIFVLISVVPALGKSSKLFDLKNNQNSYTTQTYVPTIVSESKSSLNNPQYLIQLASLALNQNAIKEAFDLIDQINKIDSRSYYGNYFPALTLEAMNSRPDAIKYRERLKELDPWNTASQLELIRNYLSIGEKAAAQEVAALIKRNYPGSQSDIDAAALLVG
jgi:tetratricopeptide (TPR) repeat protein